MQTPTDYETIRQNLATTSLSFFTILVWFFENESRFLFNFTINYSSGKNSIISCGHHITRVKIPKV